MQTALNTGSNPRPQDVDLEITGTAIQYALLMGLTESVLQSTVEYAVHQKCTKDGLEAWRGNYGKDGHGPIIFLIRPASMLRRPPTRIVVVSLFNWEKFKFIRNNVQDKSMGRNLGFGWIRQNYLSDLWRSVR